MNTNSLALVQSEPEQLHLHQTGSKLTLGDIFIIEAGNTLALQSAAPEDPFAAARNVADANKGKPVLFSGTFPDGKNRVQATMAVPPGEKTSKAAKNFATIFQTSSENVTINYYTEIKSKANEKEACTGHTYLSLTASL